MIIKKIVSVFAILDDDIGLNVSLGERHNFVGLDFMKTILS